MARSSFVYMLVVALLAGCASPMEVLTGGRVRGDAASVTVIGLEPADALPFAVAHCSRFNSAASFWRRSGADTVFRCSKS